MEVVFRKATKDEVEDVLFNRMDFLYRAIGQQPSEEFHNTTREYLYQHMGDDSLSCYIATCNGQIISSVIVCFYQVIPKVSNITGKIGYVFNVYTLQEYRRQGLATKLLQMMIDEVKQLGIGELYLSATEEGKSLYEKLQFVKLEDEMRLSLV